MELRLEASALAQVRNVFARVPALMRDEMLIAVKTADQYLHGELGQALPQGAGSQSGGGLAGSLFTDEQVLGDNVIGMTASQQPYAEYVEFGRGPGRMPPHEPVAEWVRAKLNVPEDQVEGVTFLIRRTIAARGTRANPVWQRTLDANEPQLLAMLGRGVDRTLQRLVQP